MAEDQEAVAAPPSYELIGAGVINDSPDGDGDGDDGRPRSAGIASIALRQAMNDCLQSLRSIRFWLTAVTVVLASWGAAILLVLVVVTGGGYPPEARGLAYILTAALMPVAASLLGVCWGLAREGPGPDQDTGRFNGPLRRWFTGTAKGAVFTALAAAFLLILGVSSGVSAAISGVSAAVILAETMVFSGIAAGAAWCFRRQALARFVAWTVAGVLVIGNLVAVSALIPAVSAPEPVSVAMNVQRDAAGRIIAYECSPVIVATVEVAHTERIFWMAMTNPVVIFSLLAGEAVPENEVLGWLPGELQNIAEGSQTQCVNAAGPGGSSVQLPLAFSGLAMQFGVAGVFLAAGNMSSRRRRDASLS